MTKPRFDRAPRPVERPLALVLRVIGLLGCVLPLEMRASWRAEWRAELSYLYRRARQDSRTPAQAGRAVAAHVAGALSDVVQLGAHAWSERLASASSVALGDLGRRPWRGALALIGPALAIATTTIVVSMLDLLIESGSLTRPSLTAAGVVSATALLACVALAAASARVAAAQLDGDAGRLAGLLILLPAGALGGMVAWAGMLRLHYRAGVPWPSVAERMPVAWLVALLLAAAATTLVHRSTRRAKSSSTYVEFYSMKVQEAA